MKILLALFLISIPSLANAQEYCHIDAVCDDGNPCTTDLCIDADFGVGFCTHINQCVETYWCAGRSCYDSNPCTRDSCDETNKRCVNDPAPLNGRPCDDGLFCYIGEACLNGTCDRGGGPTPCATGLVCDETADACVEVIIDPPPPPPPPAPIYACGLCVGTDCDDDNPNTLDACDEFMGCIHVPIEPLSLAVDESAGGCDSGGGKTSWLFLVLLVFIGLGVRGKKANNGR